MSSGDAGQGQQQAAAPKQDACEAAPSRPGWIRIRFRRIRNAAPDWTSLSHLGGHPLLKLSPLWIVLIPAVVKVIEAMGPRLHLQTLPALPFSLKMFYFSAISAFLATALFAWKCPRLAKYKDFSEFARQKKGGPELLREFLLDLQHHHAPARSLALNLDYIGRQFATAPLDQATIEAIQANAANALPAISRLAIENKHLGDAFWSLRALVADLSPVWRTLCTLLYTAAFGMLVAVLGRNAWIVIRYVLG